MKYIVTLRDRTFEVEVENGEAMILDEYEAKAPASAVAAPATMASVATGAAQQPVPPVAVGAGTPVPAPMPGNIVSLEVKVGDSVAEGDVVAVMEAMKMNVEVVAPCAGAVKQILVEKGAVVATDDALMTI